MAWTRGRRMSASISNTRCPACAKLIARLVATSVLPSPGPVLVTTRLREPSSADENSTLVRTARTASAKFGGTPLLMSGSWPLHELGLRAGTIPSDARPR
jgi:hypothetical protein